MDTPLKLVMLALGLLIAGVALPFLMAIGLLTSTLPLNFVSYACSVAGFIVGFTGITQYRRRSK